MRDFFEHQAIAQRRTRLLLLCMALSVIALGSVVFAALCWVRSLFLMRVPDSVQLPTMLQLWPLFLWSVGITAALVALAGLLRTYSLRKGGSCLAEMLDARLVSGQAQDGLDRRLLNVVAEMALAAGTPVPQVYVLDREPGINALAAGWDLGDSVICVTRGCLLKLTRNELQGVVAHEFSHILHGDARLNLRLMGAVFGMVSLGLVGKQLLRGSAWSTRRDASLVLVGGALSTLGALGGFLGNLVKAAVSRQREYLADAAAVQYTRDPDGIARALKKIGGYVLGARLSTVRAEEVEHFFLEDTGSTGHWAWLTTHPPLAERIRRLEPHFDGQFIAPAEGLAEAVGRDESSARPAPLLAAGVSGSLEQPPLTAADVVPMIGTSHAQVAAPELEPVLQQACENSFSACGLVLALLVGSNKSVALRQAARILEHAGPELLAEAQRLHPAVLRATRLERLTLATLAAPALRALSPAQKQAQRRAVGALIAEDGSTSIFELVINYMLTVHWQEPPHYLSKRSAGLSACQAAVQLVLSCLVHTGAAFDDSAERAFAEAGARLPSLTLRLLPQQPRLLSGFTTALDELQALRPTARAALIEACAHAVVADGRVTEDELTLLRALCLALDAPLPPLEQPSTVNDAASRLQAV
jgi:Zn-dependent protease with chaperone function